MELIDKIRNKIDGLRNKSVSRVELVTERGSGFVEWDGALYQSDIVRSCIRPKANAIGKLVAKHIRETVKKDGTRKIEVNPESYIRFLLEEPNPWMSGRVMWRKMAVQLMLNNNAFALIIRDENGYPTELLPINAMNCEALVTPAGELLLRFIMANGKMFTFRYSDIIHLRDDFEEDDFFGSPKGPILKPLMNIMGTIDQGIVKAIRNSSVIRWLLKFTSSTRPEDIEKATKKFAQSFLDVSNGTGVAGVDSKADAIQVQPHDYVPNAVQMDRITERIYRAFNTNAKIIDSSRSEEEWNSYFDAEVEPVIIQMQDEFTRKLFTRKERSFGNCIVFEASSWDSASISTKMQLSNMVDRGALTPNEWRATFNLAPVPGGDKPIRRLDTAPTTPAGGESA